MLPHAARPGSYSIPDPRPNAPVPTGGVRRSRGGRRSARGPARLAARASRAFQVLAVGAIAFGAAPSIAAQKPTAVVDYYHVGKERVQLQRLTDRIALRPAHDSFDQALGAELGARVGWTVTRLSVGLLEVRLPERSQRSAIRDLRRDPRVAWAEPVFTYEGALVYVAGSVLVEPKSQASTRRIREVARDLGVVSIQSLEAFPDVLRLDLPAERDVDALGAVERFFRIPGVELSEPLFYWRAAHTVVNDPLFDQQWSLQNGRLQPWLPDADVDAPGAWTTTRGSAGIVIAVIDDGVDVFHPDLASRLVEGIDTTDEAPPAGVAGNAKCGDGHGTACAGIIAAVQDNGTGVTGVAPHCSVMPVRIARDDFWTTNAWAASGIQLAWQSGADVLSNSWGGGSPSGLISSAIAGARNLGRGGLGCPVLFSSGNQDHPVVSYPARFPYAIAVGATSPCDERKSPASCDGESWWGANYGLDLDLVAPGVLIPTTDIGGSCGYVAGDFTTTFNGTSSACPLAAGVAGLVLSANPFLNASGVRWVLEHSADDLGAPGWDAETGWGRINARRAVSFVTTLARPIVARPPTTALPSSRNGGGLPGPVDTCPNLQTATGSVDDVYRGDYYQFSGLSGEIVTIEHCRTDLTGGDSSDLDPYLCLIDPWGVELASDDDSAGDCLVPGPFGAALIANFELPASGVYTIVASSYQGYGNETGTYRVTLCGTNSTDLVLVVDEGSSCAAIGVAQQVRTGSIDSAGAGDHWEFDGTAGEIVTIQLCRTDNTGSGTSTLDPYLCLLDPSGAEVAQDDDSNGDCAVPGPYGASILNGFELPTTGTYTVVASSFQGGGSETGTYRLVLDGATNPLSLAIDEGPACSGL